MEFDAKNGWRLLKNCYTSTNDLGERGIREFGVDKNVETVEERLVYLPGNRWQVIAKHKATLDDSNYEVVTNGSPEAPRADEEFDLAFYGIQTATNTAPPFWQRATFWLVVIGAGLIGLAVILRRRQFGA